MENSKNKNSLFAPLAGRESLSKIIARQIEEAIIERKYPPGSKLPSEFELGEQFGVSRTSIREALQTLKSHGLISIQKGRGIFVNDITADSVVNPIKNYLQLKLERDYVLDLVHARQIIEPAIASYAALKHTKKDIELLKNDIIELEECKCGYLELAKLDMTFHLHLAEASGNSIVPLLLNPVHRLIPEVSSVYATVQDAKESALLWHRRILKYVVSGDAEAAHKAMTKHLKIAEEHAIKMLELKNNLLVDDKEI